MLKQADIIKGAYYAMDQAGQLLIDAFVLYNSNRWPSSLVLAVLALEELGKAEVLLERAKDAAKTGPKSRKDVLADLRSHPRKLKSARGPLTIQAFVGFFWGDPPAPGTPEEREFLGRVSEANRLALENAPDETHEARMRALYVDLGVDETWRRPAQMTGSDAHSMLSTAAHEYAMHRLTFVNPTDSAIKALMESVPPPPEVPHVKQCQKRKA